MRWLALLFVALALIAAGCGGSDDESSAADETTIEETTAAEETTDETTTDDDADDVAGILADEDCLALAAAGATFAQAFTGQGISEEQREAFDELASKVPDEIATDVQTLAEAYAQIADELQDVGLQAGATPSAQQLAELQAALASVDQEGVSAASERISAWADDNCDAAGG
jgi:hypothetical protein